MFAHNYTKYFSLLENRKPSLDELTYCHECVLVSLGKAPPVAFLNNFHLKEARVPFGKLTGQKNIHRTMSN